MATGLTRYTPTAGTGLTRLPEMMSRLFDESLVMPSFFDRSFQQVPGSNLYETDDAYIVQVAIPGVDPEQIDIQATANQLVLKGTQNIKTPENAAAIWRGVVGGDFSESMGLPGETDASKAIAQYDQGILTITLPKAEHLKTKSVKVSVSA